MRAIQDQLCGRRHPPGLW